MITLIYFTQVNQIMDPVVDSTYKDIWMTIAKVIINIKCVYLLLI